MQVELNLKHVGDRPSDQPTIRPTEPTERDAIAAKNLYILVQTKQIKGKTI